MLGKSLKRLAGFCKKECGERVAAAAFSLFWRTKAINPGVWGRAPKGFFNLQIDRILFSCNLQYQEKIALE